MTMNSSGPISLGGTTAGQSIELENGGPGTAQVSLNDTAVRNLAGVPSGTIIMPTNFYGKSNRVTLNFTISANSLNYDVFTNASASPSYVAGKTDVTVTINPAVSVGSSAVPAYGMLVPASFNPGDTVTIVNNGYIVGAGGNGGNGGNPGGFTGNYPGSPGASGGNALFVAFPTTVTNNGTVGSGGGGGGGGNGSGAPNASSGNRHGGGGGGGGAGANVGNAGSGLGGGSPGGAGTLTTGGGGGSQGGSNTSPGGAGGGLGSPGSTAPSNGQGSGGGGGGTGNYITGNSFVTWPAIGTRLGGVA